MVDIYPKEVHYVCPFIKGKAMTRAEFLELSKSAKVLDDFKKSIELLDCKELIEIRRRINASQATNKVKIQLYNWKLGQPLTIKAYKAVCLRYPSIMGAPMDILEDPEHLDEDGKPILKYCNPEGLKYQKPNFQTTLAIMGVAGIEPTLQTAYARALSAREQCQEEYMNAVESGFATEIESETCSIECYKSVNIGYTPNNQC